MQQSKNTQPLRNVFFVHSDIPAHAAREKKWGLTGEIAVHRDGRALSGPLVRVLPEGQTPRLAQGESLIPGKHNLDDVVFLTIGREKMKPGDIVTQMKQKNFTGDAWTGVQKVAERSGIYVPPEAMQNKASAPKSARTAALNAA